MGNTRAFCDEEGNEGNMVPPVIEVRDNLGVLAVHILAAKEDLSSISYGEAIDKLHTIVIGLHETYDKHRPID